MTFDPRAAFETRSIEYQPSNGIYDPNLAFEAANNEDFELSGRDPVLGGRLREKRGVAVSVRASRGRDKDAACGQLRRQTIDKIKIN